MCLRDLEQQEVNMPSTERFPSSGCEANGGYCALDIATRPVRDMLCPPGGRRGKPAGGAVLVH
jgi:hypothetical protein